MKFLTGLYIKMTSPRQVMTSYIKNKVTYAGENFGEITKGILEICYGSGVMQQKVGLG